MLHYIQGQNNGNKSASLITVYKILITVISFCLLIFQGSGDDAALAKMLKVIRFLVGHLVHLVKVKILYALHCLFSTDTMLALLGIRFCF